MNGILFLAVVVLRLQALPPLVGPLVPDSGGVVRGVVRRADSGQPIPAAQVALIAEGQSVDQAMARATITDVSGQFMLRGVEPGSHNLLVQAEGYFGVTGLADASTRTARIVHIAEGQHVDLGVVNLIAGSTISGRIAGPDGKLVAAATVEALKGSYVRGRLAFTLVKRVKTDDLGEYRLFWIPPGAYYIRAVYRSNADAGTERYARVFFPGIPEEDAAPPVLVNSGSELSGIDVRIPTTPTMGITISGQVVADESGGDTRVTSIHLAPRDRRVLLLGDDADELENQAANASQGRFEIRNVPPGGYSLNMVVRHAGRVRPVSLPVDVVDRDITNITVPLTPAFGLPGKATLDGGAPGTAILSQSIQLVPTEPMPGIDSFAINPHPQTGEFTLPAVPAGKYAIRVSSVFRSADTYVADLKRGETSVFDSGLTIGGSLREPLEVVLKSKGGILTGTITDPTKLRPFPYATVVLVPEKARRQNFALYKHTLSSEDGNFVFTGIPPGNYKLLAWASITAGAWENAIFLQRFEGRGAEVTIVDDTPRRIELTVIP
jgi:hypothetical protein